MSARQPVEELLDYLSLQQPGADGTADAGGGWTRLRDEPRLLTPTPRTGQDLDLLDGLLASGALTPGAWVLEASEVYQGDERVRVLPRAPRLGAR